MKFLVAMNTLVVASLSSVGTGNCVTNNMGSLILTTCSDGSSHMQNNMGNVGISSGYNGTGTSWTGITTRSGNVSNITINNSDGSQQGYSVYRTGRNRGAIKDHNSNSWSTYKVTDPGADSSDDGLDVD